MRAGPPPVRAGKRRSRSAVGEREGKGRTRAGPRVDPNAAAVAIGDLSGDRQADAGPRIFALRVQPLEHLEDAVAMARLDADAVVANRDDPQALTALGRDMNA